ncbi:DUF276 domain-containing protein [Borrelia puertoricensis]|uniref:DUF276 domain-containing protein n=1 Tax=Borrelia puertoricensis TaxID=2756107 RepID=UPI001FF63DFF|nr:DUF276 domain-containing protein [Borrelia puertoricensis]UPA18542.1 DUF276 domain-containing protein [Borrelia puertoricensis]
MSIAFDNNFGILKQNISQIINTKREYLKQTHGIVIKDDPSSIYNIIAASLATVEEQIINELNLFMDKLKPQGEYWKAIESHISVKSTTHEALRNAILNLPNVKYVNIVSTAGKANIYLIVNDTILNDSKNTIKDSTFKANLWEVLYSTIPSGTILEGDIDIDGINSHNQVKSYKVSLGKTKYIYLKVKYKLDLKNHIYLNIDMQIREIYRRIINNNYSDMGIGFEYQDFTAPVNEIKGIQGLKINACIKDNPETSISNISTSDFKENQDIEISPSEILNFSLTDRLLIDIQT